MQENAANTISLWNALLFSGLHALVSHADLNVWYFFCDGFSRIIHYVWNHSQVSASSKIGNLSFEYDMMLTKFAMAK